MIRRLFLGVLVLAAAGAGPAPRGSVADWPAYGRDPGGSRYSPADQITREKAGVEVTGLAVYRIVEPELTYKMLNFSYGERADINVTYTRSRARGDLNTMSNYFDTIMWPVLGRNEYAPAPTDAPNRLLARARFMPRPKWLLVGNLSELRGLT